MLNLGNITAGGVVDSLDVDEAYIDWMEADAQFVNLMNALEIAVKAQKSESSECLNFAEDLLGCSCEVVTTGSSKKITDNAFTAIEGAKKAAESVKKTATRLKSDISFNKSVKATKIIIATALVEAADYGKRGKTKLMDIGSIAFKNSRQEVTIDDALDTVFNAAEFVSKALAQFNNGTKSQVRAGFKDNGSGKINPAKESSMSVMKVYLTARKGVANILKEARAVFRECNKAVMKSKRPERKRIEI